MDIKEKHEQMLYTSVRVRTMKAGGSGTVLYSAPINGDDGIYETYVLTNNHVIAENVKVDKKWSTLLKREVKTDILTDCSVEFFENEYQSWEAGHSAYKAEIMCYDVDMDLGLLRLRSEKPFPFVAKLFPRDEHKKRLRVFMKLYAVGSGLGHPPLQTKGELAGFCDVIDNYPYWLSTAPTIFGNSGGSVFLAETGEFIGVPSRVSVVMMGMGGSAITHMSYFIPITSVYDFLEDQVFNFIFDPDISSKACADSRKLKRNRDEKNMAIDMSRQSKKEDDEE